MITREGEPISRRTFIRNAGLTAVGSVAVGSGTVFLAERLLAPSEHIDSRRVSATVAQASLPAINLFLDGGIVRNGEITQAGDEGDTGGLPMQSFTNNIQVLTPISGIQVVDFRQTRYAVEFGLPADTYHSILANPVLSDEQKNKRISERLNFLLVIAARERGDNSDDFLFNRMMKDPAGNWIRKKK